MKKFEKPEMEVIVFEAEDIITTSGEPTRMTVYYKEDLSSDPPQELLNGDGPGNLQEEGTGTRSFEEQTEAQGDDTQSPAAGSETPDPIEPQNPVEQPDTTIPETTPAEELVSENNFDETVPDTTTNE